MIFFPHTKTNIINKHHSKQIQVVFFFFRNPSNFPFRTSPEEVQDGHSHGRDPCGRHWTEASALSSLRWYHQHVCQAPCGTWEEWFPHSMEENTVIFKIKNASHWGLDCFTTWISLSFSGRVFNFGGLRPLTESMIASPPWCCLLHSKHFLWLVVGGIILRKFNYEKDSHLEIREETRYVKFSEHMGKSLSFFILNFYWKALVRLARMMQKAAPGQLLFGEPTNKILPPSLKVKEASDSDGVRMCSEFLVLHLILHDIRTDIGTVSVRYRVAVPSRIKSPLQQEDGIIVKMKGKGDVWNLIVDSESACCIHLPCWHSTSKTTIIIVKGLLAAVCAKGGLLKVCTYLFQWQSCSCPAPFTW